MASLTILDWFLLVTFLVSVPTYLLILVTMSKFQNQAPFSSHFFRISFHVAIFDLIHLFEDWLIGRFAHFPWLFIDKLVTTAPSIFGKLSSTLWWFAGLGQTLGVLYLAINRMSVVQSGEFLRPPLTLTMLEVVIGEI